MNLFTRYLLRAHIGPFFFAFVALTGVILINTLAKELASLAGKGLPMTVVLEFFILSLPANIALTMPMAVLVSVLYTFSTLAAENEITALRASGVDLRRAVMPLVVTAGLIAGGMIWFNDQVLPTANYRWRMLMTAVAQTRSLLFLQPQTINSIPGETGAPAYYLEAQEIDGETGFMRLVTIYDVSSTETTRTINADSGKITYSEQDSDLLLTLFDGDMREVDFVDQADFQTFTFQRQVMVMAGVLGQLERTSDAGFRTDRDMTVGMMRMRIDSLRAELRTLEERGDSTRLAVASQVAEGAEVDSSDADREYARLNATLWDSAGAAFGSRGDDPWASSDTSAATTNGGVAVATQVPDVAGIDSAAALGGPLSEGERYLQARAQNIEYQIREFQVEMHKKFAIATATLAFVLIGVPIALRFPRGGIGMVIAISLGIFGIYYVGLIGGETLGDEGYVPAVVAMWATNFIVGVLGLIGFLRLGREQGTTRGAGWGELPRWLKMPRLRRSAPVKAP